MSKITEIKRICLWSGPRNISTALMYSFAQREDCKVFDEPLYGHYLQNHPSARTYHPGADEILSTMETDGDKVVKAMIRNTEKPVLFFKQMTHHLLDLDRSFMKETINIILTRDPKEMLPSFNKVIERPSINDVGYKLHIELMEYFDEEKIPYVVLDSKQVLLSPESALKKLCDSIGIPFDSKMLKWEMQQREEDGCWAKYWYANVHRSKGFMVYSPKSQPFPEHLLELLQEAMPYYEQLLAKSL